MFELSRDDNKYSQEDINKIRDHIETNGYATNYIEPFGYLISTLLIFFFLLYYINITKGYNAGLILLLGLVNMRLFMMFHDMCHKSFFPTDERKNNYKGFNFMMANTIDQWCLFSASSWNNIHSTHHKAHGNMNEYDGTRTVISSSEYDKLSAELKVLYNIVRFPPLFFILAPIYIYWISRIIHGDWLFIIKYCAWLFLLFKFGSWKLLISFLIAQYIAGFLGLILFHLQHQVNVGYWKKLDSGDKLSKDNAELLGASVQKIPWFMEYFTNGIEYHNVHHLDPGIPSYKTKNMYYDLVEKGLIPDKKVGYIQELSSLSHTIYNEKTGKYE